MTKMMNALQTTRPGLRHREPVNDAAHRLDDVHRNTEHGPDDDEQLAPAVRAALVVVPMVQFLVSRVEHEHQHDHFGDRVRCFKTVLREVLDDVSDHQHDRCGVESEDEHTLSGYHHVVVYYALFISPAV